MVFENFVTWFQPYGFLDFLLPFLLVFVIVFAVLQKTEILGKGKKNFNVIIALVLGLLFVAPHFAGTYPLGYDPVLLINEALPSISLVAIAAVMLLILMGIFGGDFAKSAMPFIAIASIVFVVYIFGSTTALNLWNSPSNAFSWWTPEITELLIIVLVFGLIIYFVTKEPGSKTAGVEAVKSIGKLFEKK